MKYTIYDYAMFFFVYSFIGYLVEEIFTAFRYGRFINKGFLNGPLCPIYGITMVLITNNLRDLASYPVFQFAEAVILITFIEYISGMFLKKVIGVRLWDYSEVKWNFRGYICVYASLFWGIGALAGFWLIHPFIFFLLQLIPATVKNIVLIILLVLFILDVLVTVAAIIRWKRKIKLAKNVVRQLKYVRFHIGEKTFQLIQKRMFLAFPELQKEIPSKETGFGIIRKRVFAQGMCFEKVVWIFLTSAFVGDWTETFYIWFQSDRFLSRSSLLYGTFSIVWGLGGALASAILYSFRNKILIFVCGFLLGGVFEYSCSVFTEVVLGTTFWNYSKMPFNLNGRVNLMFCLFWGLLSIVWIKILYPAVSRPIEKVPVLIGKIMTQLVILIFILNILISGIAINRYVQRVHGEEAKNRVEQFLDTSYPDALIEKTYPNIRIDGKLRK